MATRLEHFSDLKEKQYWNVEKMSREELYQAFAELNGKMNILYKFVLGYNDYINMRHNYTSDVDLTMLEAHLLTDICDYPNSTVTSLAEAWNRSRSATSQTVRRLMAKGLVERENSPEDGKVYYLHATELGVHVSDQHKRYDVEDTIKTVRSLLKQLSMEEIQTMFQALECYDKLL